MIEPQELRINNLIYIPSTDQILPITAINMDLGVWVNRSLGVLGFDQIEPIELTEDWLLKFGFEAERSTVYLKLKYSTNVSDYVLYDRETKELLFVKDNQLWLCKQEYIHQLQNLYFALTGEELTIKEQP